MSLSRAHSRPPASRARGFTVLEVLVSTVILAMIVVLLATITDRMSDIWRRTTGSIIQWQSARTGFEAMNRRISQATLNTTWAYYDGERGTGNLTTTDPKSYGRASDLHFLSGPAATLIPGIPNTTTQAIFFQAPLGRSSADETRGLPQILNGCGFFVQLNDSADFRPAAPILQSIPGTRRFRLMEAIQDSSQLAVSATPGSDWVEAIAGDARPLAENVIALIIQPRYSRFDTSDSSLLAPNYLYDSRESREFSSPDISGNTLHQLPPLLQISMVAIDERSATRLESGGLGASDLFDGAPFTDSSDYADDMRRLEDNLKGAGLNYRVFSSTIIVRGAKWSGD